MMDAAFCNSAAESGARGCDCIVFAVLGEASAVICVDIFAKVAELQHQNWNGAEKNTSSRRSPTSSFPYTPSDLARTLPNTDSGMIARSSKSDKAVDQSYLRASQSNERVDLLHMA